MARRPRKFVQVLGMPKPVKHVRGPRVRTVGAEPLDLPNLGPYASMPERKLAHYLDQHHIPYKAQQSFGGGNQSRGGAVVDFEFDQINTIARIQSYWHGLPGAKQKDDAQTILLASQHKRVVDVWVGDIDTRIDWVVREQIGVML